MNPVLGIVIVAMAMFVTGCGQKETGRYQGYVEGEFVQVASPGAGRLESLKVSRGQQVQAGDRLFDLENIAEKAVRDEAARRLAQAKSSLEDIRKGRRPEEIAAIEAQIKQAKAASVLSEHELERQERLAKTGVASKQELDRARAARDQDIQKIEQLQADLDTAKLGARADQIIAQEENVRALEAALAKAEWDLSQKSQSAPEAAFVFDTLYREGEWVAAGRPVVSLLPPGNVKVRAFVPQAKVGAMKIGDPVKVTIDGRGEPIAGKIRYVSPQAEYTPPVIYSRESRGKLVFMIEATFDADVAATLRPGQPVDLELSK